MSRDRRSPLVTVALVVAATGAGVGLGWIAYAMTIQPLPPPVAAASSPEERGPASGVDLASRFGGGA